MSTDRQLPSSSIPTTAFAPFRPRPVTLSDTNGTLPEFPTLLSASSAALSTNLLPSRLSNQVMEDQKVPLRPVPVSIRPSEPPRVTAEPPLHSRSGQFGSNISISSDSSSGSTFVASAAQHTNISSEAVDLTYLFSAPFFYFDAANQPVPMSAFDNQADLNVIRACLKDAHCEFRLRSSSATISNLRSQLTKGCRVLHYSGHGMKDALAFEETNGAMKQLDVQLLKAIVGAGADSAVGLQLVVVSACHSETAGAAFVQAGVPHVIAIQSGERLTDSTSQTFMRSFYEALLRGKTVQQAFDIGVSVITKPKESKFLLLPAHTSHDVSIFSLAPGVTKDLTPELPPNRLPAMPDKFMGRNLDMYAIINKFFGPIPIASARMINVTGEQGIGKSALAIATAHYVLPRNLFDGGVFVLDVNTIAERHRSTHAGSLTSIDEKGFGAVFAPELGAQCANDYEFHSLLTKKKDSVLLVLNDVDALCSFESFHLFLDAILDNCGAVKLLVTSREPIEIRNSRFDHRLGPLQPEDALCLFLAIAPRPMLLSEFSQYDATRPETADFKALTAGEEGISVLGGIPRNLFAAKNLLACRQGCHSEKHEGHSVSDLASLWASNVAKEEGAGFWTRMVAVLQGSSPHPTPSPKAGRGDSKEPTVSYVDLKRHASEHFAAVTTAEERLPSNEDFRAMRALLKLPQTEPESQPGLEESVSFANFEQFWRFFGPFCRTIKRIRNFWLPTNPVFVHGIMDRSLAEKMLAGKEAGAFLLRFSPNSPASIIFSYVTHNGLCNHISAKDTTMSFLIDVLSEHDDKKRNSKSYKTLQDAIAGVRLFSKLLVGGELLPKEKVLEAIAKPPLSQNPKELGYAPVHPYAAV